MRQEKVRVIATETNLGKVNLEGRLRGYTAKSGAVAGVAVETATINVEAVKATVTAGENHKEKTKPEQQRRWRDGDGETRQEG
jgi:hypothetical protein